METTISKWKFKPGAVVQTAGVASSLSPICVAQALRQHLSGNWGRVCADDAKANERALDPDHPARIMSVYVVSGVKIWIITEWDRSVTTVLLPEEY